MSSTGTMTWSSSGLRIPASTIVTVPVRPIPPRKRAIVSSGRWVADSPIRCGGAGRQVLEAFEAQGEMGAALAAGDRVDLVDDDVLDASEDLAGPAREHQVQRFGGRDEDVRRVADDVAARLARRVAGPRGDRDGGAGRPSRPAASAIPASGDRRLRSMSYVRALSGETYRTRTVAFGRSRSAPVAGASWPGGPGTIGTRPGSCRSPSARGSACGGRPRSPPSPRTGPSSGASNVASNQARTGALNGASGSGPTLWALGWAVAGAVLATGRKV